MDSDGLFLPILVAIVVVIITIVILFRRFLRSGKQYILLTGLNDSGKTLVYSQLLHNKHVTTFTSIQDNIDNYTTEGKSIGIVDLPGFHSIRQQFFDKYKDNSKGILYIVDSVTLPKNIRDAAIVLYNILTDPVVIKNRPDILIVCNKQDQTLAKGSNVIKSMLEKELNTLRNTQLNQLEQLDAKEHTNSKLGDISKDFSFANLYCKVDFTESYAFSKNGSVDLEGLKKWVGKLAN
ncbi:signal recognition particle receptor beta [Rhynchophorus ferrugineus]|uniref:signal recognition particle receptor beta n=1 Tax=Rhynchophorus ferrugineus TaxID=354439 RepID=UPI003FCD062F